MFIYYFFQAGLLNKLMHNMGSPFTNTVMPQQLMGDKISSSNTFSGPATFTSPKASDQPEVTLNQPTLINLKKCGIESGFQVMMWDAGVHLLVFLLEAPREAETKVGSHIPLFQLNTGETGLVEQPVCQLSVDSMDGDLAFSSNSRQERVMILGILSWKTATHYGAFPGNFIGKFWNASMLIEILIRRSFIHQISSLRPRYFHSRMIPIAGCHIF